MAADLRRGSRSLCAIVALSALAFPHAVHADDYRVEGSCRDGRPQGAPVDVLTGFVDADGNARGRPVGVAIDRQGDLLVADDVGNVVWRVSGDATAAQAAR